jgi:hypothetical protein
VAAGRPVQEHTLRLEKGTIVVRSIPAARVAIGTVPCGEVPIQLTMYEGTYLASFQCDPEAAGCANRPEATAFITVQPGTQNHPFIYLWR